MSGNLSYINLGEGKNCFDSFFTDDNKQDDIKYLWDLSKYK